MGRPSAMKAMTLYQPWASLIAEGVKTIETRPKQHPWRSAIGQTIAVHAATKRLHHGKFFLLGRDARVAGLDPERAQEIRYAQVPFGAVVATCTLVDVVPIAGGFDEFIAVPGDRFFHHETEEHDRWWEWERVEGLRAFNAEEVTDRIGPQLPFGDFAPGRSALLLDDIRKCAPVPCRGHQGLWTLPDAVADNLVGWAESDDDG